MYNFRRKTDVESFKAFRSIDAVSDIVDKHIRGYRGRTAIRYDAGARYESIEFQDYQSRIEAFIQFLNVQGTTQEVLATFCKNRLEWDMVALGSFYTANILFPLDTRTNDPELRHLLSMNPPAFMLVSRAQLARFRSLKKETGLSTRIILADLTHNFEDIDAPELPLNSDELSMKDIVAAYIPEKGIRRSDLLARDDTVLGHYPTSGTTSLPKVVCISHGNIVSEVNESVDVLNLRPKEEILNIGPYTHIATLASGSRATCCMDRQPT